MKELWLAILQLAVADAVFGVPTGINQSKETRVHMTNDARDYILKPNKDFDTVCELAGLEPEYVRRKVATQIVNQPTAETLAESRQLGCIAKPKQVKAKRILIADRLFAFNGETLSLSEWSERSGLSIQIISSRLNQHWTFERAITQPLDTRKGKGGAAKRKVGVVLNNASALGTGGGSDAQDSHKIDFSKPLRKAS